MFETLEEKLFNICVIYFEGKPQKTGDVYAFAERISKEIFLQSYCDNMWKRIAYRYAETFGFKIAI